MENGGQGSQTNSWYNYNNCVGFTNYTYAQLSSAEFTFEYWFYAKTYTSALYMRTQMSSASNVSIELTTKINTNGAFVVDNQYWVPNRQAVSSETVKLDGWNHFAFVWNKGNCMVFLNGKLVCTGSGMPGENRAALAFIKMTSSYTAYLYIDEVMIAETAKYLVNFEPPHGPYYIPQGGE